jgi:hypothetical protein
MPRSLFLYHCSLCHHTGFHVIVQGDSFRCLGVGTRKACQQAGSKNSSLHYHYHICDLPSDPYSNCMVFARISPLRCKSASIPLGVQQCLHVVYIPALGLLVNPSGHTVFYQCDSGRGFPLVSHNFVDVAISWTHSLIGWYFSFHML